MEKIYRNYRPLFNYFNHLVGCPKANFGSLNLALYHIWPKDDWEPRNELGSKAQLSTSVGFKLGTFRSEVVTLTHLP